MRGTVYNIYIFIAIALDENVQRRNQKKIPTPKTEVGKNKLTIRYLYHETYRKPNEQLFSQ